jgi:hypothetical protein
VEIDVAVEAVCALGRKLETDLVRAEEAKEAERELRRWRPMPNGGHDPELFQTKSAEPTESVQRLSPVRDPALPMHKPNSVLSDQSEK